jgi:hypothetical protein
MMIVRCCATRVVHVPGRVRSIGPFYARQLAHRAGEWRRSEHDDDDEGHESSAHSLIRYRVSRERNLNSS